MILKKSSIALKEIEFIYWQIKTISKTNIMIKHIYETRLFSICNKHSTKYYWTIETFQSLIEELLILESQLEVFTKKRKNYENNTKSTIKIFQSSDKELVTLESQLEVCTKKPKNYKKYTNMIKNFQSSDKELVTLESQLEVCTKKPKNYKKYTNMIKNFVIISFQKIIIRPFKKVFLGLKIVFSKLYDLLSFKKNNRLDIEEKKLSPLVKLALIKEEIEKLELLIFESKKVSLDKKVDKEKLNQLKNESQKLKNEIVIVTLNDKIESWKKFIDEQKENFKLAEQNLEIIKLNDKIESLAEQNLEIIKLINVKLQNSKNSIDWRVKFIENIASMCDNLVAKKYFLLTELEEMQKNLDLILEECKNQPNVKSIVSQEKTILKSNNKDLRYNCEEALKEQAAKQDKQAKQENAVFQN